MKIQDIILIIIFILLILKKNDKWTIGAGLLCFFASIFLFAEWIFFTAERLTWFGAAFFLLATYQQISSSFNIKNKNK